MSPAPPRWLLVVLGKPPSGRAHGVLPTGDDVPEEPSGVGGVLVAEAHGVGGPDGGRVRSAHLAEDRHLAEPGEIGGQVLEPDHLS